MLTSSFPSWEAEKREPVTRNSCSSPDFPSSEVGGQGRHPHPYLPVDPSGQQFFLLALVRITRGSFKNLHAQILNISLWESASETANYTSRDSPLMLKE